MKKFLYFLLATAMLATFGCTGDESMFAYSVGTPNPDEFTPKGTVTGVLVDACTNDPIANAVVYIMDKKAVTNSVGVFTIKNVPANTAVGNEPANSTILPVGSGTSLLSNVLNSWDTYNVVIDLSSVNAAREKAGLTLYPNIAYSAVQVSYTSLGESSDLAAGSSNETNHDTPVDGFVANIKPMVGKLAADLNIQAVSGIDSTPLSGATIQLISLSPIDGFSAANNATGDLVNTIATATTNSEGKASFTAVETKHVFYAKVTWTDPVTGHVWTGREGIGPNGALTSVPVVWTECDGTTTNFYLAGPNPAIPLYDASDNVDFVDPAVVSVTPANLSDIAPSDPGETTSVVFTFSEILKPTQYLLNTDATSTTGIYQDVDVNYMGPKASNIAHTMAWDDPAKPQVLTISFATAASSKYTVDISALVGNANVTDLNGNTITSATNTVVNFTTEGGADVDAPAVTKFGSANETRIDWLPVANAYAYRIYVARTIDGVTSSYLVADETPTTTYSIENSDLFAAGPPAGNFYGPATPGSLIPFNNGDTKISYSVYVVTLNSDGVESDASNIVTIDDMTKPTATTADYPAAAGMAASTSQNGTATITFSEVMTKTEVLDAASWGFSFPAGTTGTTVTFGTITVSYELLASGNVRTVATVPWTITVSATGSVPAGAITWTCTATDLNGNGLLTSPF